MENVIKHCKSGIWKKYQNSYLSYFLMYNFYYLSWALFSSLISVYLMGMGFKASEVSLVVSASFLSSLVSQPIIGKWNNQYDLKKVNTILFSIAAIGGVVFMQAKNLLIIMMSYSIVLMMINGVNPVMEKIATASCYQYGKIRIWGTIGYALGSQAAGLLYEKVSPQSIFVVFVLTMLLCIIGFLGTKPNLKKSEVQQAKKVSSMNLFKNKKLIYYLFVCAVFYGVTNMSNTFIPSMLTNKGLNIDVTSTILSLAVFCEAPFVLFSSRFMDKIANKKLLLIAVSMVCIQCAVYGFDMPMLITILITLIAKHPAGMLYIMINLKVINTIIDEQQQITALALVATLKNLVSIIFQNVAGNIIDMTSYAYLYQICFVCMIICLILVLCFKIDSGNDKRLFS